MDHSAKQSNVTEINPTAASSQNAAALRMIEEVFPEGKTKGGYIFPAHTEPNESEVFGLVLAHADTIRSFEKVCEKNNLTFSEGVELALRYYPFYLGKKRIARKKYRERKERDFERSLAIMGPIVEEIIDRERGKAESRSEVSAPPAKFITDADFLAGLHIKDDGLSPI